MRLFSPLAALLAMGLLFSGCGGSETGTETTSTDGSESVTESTETTPEGPAAGTLPIDYPTTSTTAEVGDTVLAPSYSFLEDAWADPEDMYFIFYDATMVTPGDVESVIDDKFDEVTMPNSLIIPLPQGETAEPGDIVLTWWQAGSGMETAVVVEGGTPTEPMVRYLGFELDTVLTDSEGVSYAVAEHQLKPNSFMVLEEAFQPGTNVAIPNDWDGYDIAQVINVADDKILVMGWAGSMEVYDKSVAIPIPTQPEVAVGDAVYYSSFGYFEAGGTVTEIDAANGRVYVEYEFAGKTEVEGLPYGEVMKASEFEAAL